MPEIFEYAAMGRALRIEIDGGRYLAAPEFWEGGHVARGNHRRDVFPPGSGPVLA